MPKLPVAVALFLSLCALAPLPAVAVDTEPVTVRLNMARVLRIATPAATVIVGNPAVADVTIQDPQTLVLTGKTFGKTNLIILDADGTPIADTTIAVTQSQTDLVTVFAGNMRTSYSCVDRCGPALMIGDQSDFATEVAKSLSTVQGVQ